MNRRFNAFALAATAITLTTINTADAGGCGGHRGHGGFSIGFGGGGGQVISGAPYGGQSHGYPARGHSQPMFSQPSYPQPNYPQPGFPQEEFSQPVYSQNGFPMQDGFPLESHPQQGGYSTQGSIPQQGSYSQPLGNPQQGGFLHAQRQSQPSNGNMQPRMQGSNISMNQAGMSQPQQQQQPSFAGNNAMNGMSAPQQNVRQANGNFAQQGSMVGNPNQPSSPAPRSNNGMVQNGGANMNNGTAPMQNSNAASGGQTQLSALQMLASISGDTAQSQLQEPIAAPIANQAAPSPAATVAEVPQFTAAASPAAGAHVGTWAVSLPGNQTIVLALSDDKSFNWNATKDGKSSSFQGQYRLEGNRLTLVRSNDLQQMAGSWTGADASFTFKLDGATTSGLAFARN